MSLIKKTYKLWLPLAAMLASASVTSIYSNLDADLEGRISQGQAQHGLHSQGIGSCCLSLIPNVVILPDDPPAHNESTADPAANGNIWTRMRNGFAFPVSEAASIRRYIHEYTRIPGLLEQTLSQGEPYLFYILNRIEQEGMPAELALLPVIESAFDPFATSPAGAAGIWQFMPDTATFVGLDRDWWYDGRRDIIASTEAALDYLVRLNKRFDGDWLLTLAAYNAGGARVQRAIRENRDAGKPVDFWNLSLPEETRSYVPKLIAVRTIIENPGDYNVTLPKLANSSYFSVVEVQGQIELSVAAQLVGISLAGLKRLNPGYDRQITSPDRSHALLVPKSVEQIFRKRVARLPQDQRVQSIRHRVRRGDSLSMIAQQYRTTISELRRVNRLEGSKIITGDVLLVPQAKSNATVAGNYYAGLM